MNVRDPFNLRRTTNSAAFDILRATATQAATGIRDKAAEVGSSALEKGKQAVEDMSFAVPRNVPSFGNPQRIIEDQLWASSGRASSSSSSHHHPHRGPHQGGGGGLLSDVQNRVGGILHPDRRNALPMYKDKPYAYAPARRVRPLYRKKRVLGLLTLILVLLLWYRGSFSEHHERARATISQWSWLQTEADAKGKVDWLERRQRVVEAFELSWDAYERHAWGYDEFHPIAKTGKQMAPKGLGWIIIDSLDTLMLMNQTSRLAHAREWLSKSLTWDQNQDVNTFETTIRMLGGLLSAHYLSNEYPQLAALADDDEGAPGEDLYLEKAKDLADRLLAAFDSPSGVPYASVNLGKMEGLPSHADDGASSTAETTTLQLEFKYMAKLTGERLFWDKAEKVMQVVDDNGMPDGLLPIYIYADSGKFRGDNIRLGSRGDSYYEYLIKQYLQTNKKEGVYEEMWREALRGVRKHLVTYTETYGFTIVGERPSGLDGPLSPKMDHLVCFLPGTIALAATGGLTEKQARRLPTWTKRDEDDMRLARELMHTCWGMYKYMKTGLAAEITYFRIADPPLPASAPHPTPPADLGPNGGKGGGEDGEDEGGEGRREGEGDKQGWRRDFEVRPLDVHNLQRPEAAESLFYMWRITGDVRYREWGWEMFKSFVEHTAVPGGGGFTSLSDASKVPPVMKDNMESFWLAETLKYLYLLFSPDDLVPLDKVVINTEGHVLPRFDMGPLFSTGWKRKPRDGNGNIIVE